MERRMEQLSVSTTTEGWIEIEQEHPQFDNLRVGFPPEQADIVIAWIKEARDELLDRSEGD